MKKGEILDLIDANLKIIKYEKLSKVFIPGISSEEVEQKIIKALNVLMEEVKFALDVVNNSEKTIKNSNCNHEVRLKHYCGLVSYSKCVLCGECFDSDNIIDWKNSVNRNKYTVILTAKYQDDEECNVIESGYTEKQIYDFIVNILNDKSDDEEIDLVQEFKKLNLKNCSINEEKKVKENYILIIGGSNKYYFGNGLYLFNESFKDSSYFVKYFSQFLNTKVELIDNKELLESYKIKKLFPDRNYNLNFLSYDTISKLEWELENQKKIPFKLIIDLSCLYNYNILNDEIKKEEYSLNLKEIFPNSYIIRICDLSKKSLEEISVFLKNINLNDETYVYQNKKFYYLDSKDVSSINLEQVCEKTKKLLKK